MSTPTGAIPYAWARRVVGRVDRAVLLSTLVDDALRPLRANPARRGLLLKGVKTQC